MQLSLIPLPRKQTFSLKARDDLLSLRLYSGKKKESYSTYIYKVLTQTEDMGVFCWVADALKSLNKPYLFGKVALEAARLSHYKNRSLIAQKEVHAAMKLVLLSELSKQDLSDTIKAVTK